MDSGFFLSFTTLALLLPIILFFMRNISRPAPVRRPPGPKTLPIIGNMHLLSSLAFRSLADLAKQHGPLMRLRLGEVETIVISSPELARDILKESDPCFADRPDSIAMKTLWYNYLDIAFSPYGDYWKQMRKICVTELLSPRCVRWLAPIRRDEVSNLIAGVRLCAGRGDPIDLTSKVFSTMSSISCRASFGKVSKDKDALMRIARQGIEIAGGFVIADFFPDSAIVSALSGIKLRLVLMRRKIDAILDDLIDQHRVNLDGMPRGRGNGDFGNEDFVDVLLRLQESGGLRFPLGNDNIKAVIYDLLSAGTDTTSTAIDWAMAELMRNPLVMAKAQAEVRQALNEKTIGAMDENEHKLKYLNLVIRETLRLHPPVPILPRASREEREINGYKIPAKVRILVNNWAMQRDPKYWPKNPDSFDPERFLDCSKEFLGADFDYLPFGAGKRMCPGITSAMTATRLVLAQLLYHFDWKLPNGVEPETMNMIELPGLTTTRKESLYVVPTLYNKV